LIGLVVGVLWPMLESSFCGAIDGQSCSGIRAFPGIEVTRGPSRRYFVKNESN